MASIFRLLGPQYSGGLSNSRRLRDITQFSMDLMPHCYAVFGKEQFEHTGKGFTIILMNLSFICFILFIFSISP